LTPKEPLRDRFFYYHLQIRDKPPFLRPSLLPSEPRLRRRNRTSFDPPRPLFDYRIPSRPAHLFRTQSNSLKRATSRRQPSRQFCALIRSTSMAGPVALSPFRASFPEILILVILPHSGGRMFPPPPPLTTPPLFILLPLARLASMRLSAYRFSCP